MRIGTKNFPESEILGELYKQALEAKGLRVELQSAVGPTEVINRALRDGLLDMYPEYIGVLLSEIHKIVDAAGERRTTAYALAKRLEERRKLHAARRRRSSATRTRSPSRSPSARRRGVDSIADLERLRRAEARRRAGVRQPLRGPRRAARAYGLRQAG